MPRNTHKNFFSMKRSGNLPAKVMIGGNFLGDFTRKAKDFFKNIGSTLKPLKPVGQAIFKVVSQELIKELPGIIADVSASIDQNIDGKNPKNSIGSRVLKRVKDRAADRATEYAKKGLQGDLNSVVGLGRMSAAAQKHIKQGARLDDRLEGYGSLRTF